MGKRVVGLENTSVSVLRLVENSKSARFNVHLKQ